MAIKSSFTSFLSLFLLLAPAEVNSYICSTPNFWLTKYNQLFSNPETSDISKWPNGYISYRWDETLTSTDISEVVKAFAEYQTKTCIRFVPHQAGNTNPYTTIAVDNSLDGIGTVCMQKQGKNVAHFGKNSRTSATMVHELGHNLCLLHEHQRADRDNYLEINSNSNCHETWNKVANNNSSKGFYDFSSQMHSPCTPCIKRKYLGKSKYSACGSQITSGLSILDADYINTLYNCGGCFRHRWISIQNLDSSQAQNLPDFGHEDCTGETIYPCRALVEGQLAAGTYIHGNSKTCSIPYGLQEHKLTENFEVLTIPGGLKTEDSEYSLKEGNGDMPNFELDAIFAEAIPAGFMPWADGTGNGTVYVVYAFKEDISTECGTKSSKNSKISLVGKVAKDVWLPFVRSGQQKIFKTFEVDFPVGGKEVRKQRGRVLICKPQFNVNTKESVYDSQQDIYKNQKLRLMQYLGRMESGTRIKLIGYISSDARYFTIDISEQPAAGPVLLQFAYNFHNSMVFVHLGRTYENTSWYSDTLFRTFHRRPNLLPGNNFKLTIEGLEHEFILRSEGEFLERFKLSFDQSIQNAKFIRIYGDVSVINFEVISPSNQILLDVNTTHSKSYNQSKNVNCENTTITTYLKAAEPREHYGASLYFLVIFLCALFFCAGGVVVFIVPKLYPKTRANRVTDDAYVLFTNE